MSESTHAYIGIKRCGCVVAAVVDNPELVKETAKSVQKFMRDGLTIERTTIEDTRRRLNACDCEPKQQGMFA